MNDMKIILDKYLEGKVNRENYEVSFLGIINPIPYNMSSNQIFYNDFGIVFWSTTQKERDDTIDFFKKKLNRVSVPGVLIMDVDEFLGRLHKYAKTTFKDKIQKEKYDILNKAFDLYAELLIVNISTSKKHRYIGQSFFTGFIDNIKRYWCYFGTMDIDLDTILKQYNKLVDSVQLKEGTKNAFGPMVVTLNNKEV